MRNAYLVGTLISWMAFCVSGAEAQDTWLSDIRKSCSGYLEIRGKGVGGTIKFQNFDLSVDAGNTLEISQEGVLLKKIEKFEAKDYVSCLKDLATIMKDVQKDLGRAEK